ncbi:hypothetical protein DFH11DRAFT_1648602, partial [Phellopilus nigrolimitatus]
MPRARATMRASLTSPPGSPPLDGFPSHINAETPSAIYEGGELGYVFVVAFGVVM